MAEPDGRSDYEKQYMSDGTSLFRSRQKMPWWWFALMGTMGLLGAVGAAADHALPVLLFVLPLLAFVTLLFSHLRVNLTDRELHVQYGLFGPKVALSQILSCEATEYSMMRFGGFGIKRAMDGTWAYSLPGAERCVEFSYRDAKGKVHKVAVTSLEADALAAAINQARGAATGTGVRAAPTSAEVPEAAEAPREAPQAHEARKG
ncbi:MAG: DUF3093 family protein [Deltaproteobacteria bacterium]|nr:DUF3093 family protein [Deltaproteobacteria bacterium]